MNTNELGIYAPESMRLIVNIFYWVLLLITAWAFWVYAKENSRLKKELWEWENGIKKYKKAKEKS